MNGICISRQCSRPCAAGKSTICDEAGLTLKPVKVKGYESENVIITDGVDDGARIVALGVQKLDPAQKVRVVSALSF